MFSNLNHSSSMQVSFSDCHYSVHVAVGESGLNKKVTSTGKWPEPLLRLCQFMTNETKSFDTSASRDLFKDIVNTIADVTQEGSTKYIVLKPTFYFHPDQRRSSSGSSNSDPRRSVSSSSSDGHGSITHHHMARKPMFQLVTMFQPSNKQLLDIIIRNK